MKEELLRTAIKLFHEYGYEKVSVSMICDKCGVIKGCFYYHFPSKEPFKKRYGSKASTFPVDLGHHEEFISKVL